MKDDHGYVSGSMGTDDVPDVAASQRKVCGHCGADVPIIGGRYAAHTRPAEGDACRDSGRPVQP